MNSLELVVTRFAELTSIEIAEATKGTGVEGNLSAIDEAREIIKKTVGEIEAKTGKKVVAKSNNKQFSLPDRTKEIIHSQIKGKAAITDSDKDS